MFVFSSFAADAKLAAVTLYADPGCTVPVTVSSPIHGGMFSDNRSEVPSPGGVVPSVAHASLATLWWLDSKRAPHSITATGGPAVTGSKSGGAALVSLLSVLSAAGVITDSTSA